MTISIKAFCKAIGKSPELFVGSTYSPSEYSSFDRFKKALAGFDIILAKDMGTWNIERFGKAKYYLKFFDDCDNTQYVPFNTTDWIVFDHYPEVYTAKKYKKMFKQVK